MLTKRQKSEKALGFLPFIKTIIKKKLVFILWHQVCFVSLVQI
jgi:hypothetical protein